MIKYKDSWNFGLILQGANQFVKSGEFDVLDNDYIQLYGLELRDDNDTKGYKLIDKESHKLIKCSHKEHAPYMKA